jgi:hypothetical protein
MGERAGEMESVVKEAAVPATHETDAAQLGLEGV